MPGTIPLPAGITNYFNQRYGWNDVPAGTVAAGSLPGAPASGYTPAAGGVPQVPNPGTTQAQALQSNLANQALINNLTVWANNLSKQFAEQMNAQNQAAIRNQQESYVPGLAGLENQASQNAAAELRGEVNPGTVNTLAQMASERGVGRGFGPSSPNSNAALLRALGLTAEGQQRQGQADFSSAVGRVPGFTPTQAPPFNPASLFITPADQQAAQYQANLLNAAPIPSAANAANFQNMMAGLNQGYGRTAPGNMFGGMSPTTSTQDIVNSIIQRYSQPSNQPAPQPAAPTQGYYIEPNGAYTSNPDLGMAPGEISVDPWTDYENMFFGE